MRSAKILSVFIGGLLLAALLPEFSMAAVEYNNPLALNTNATLDTENDFEPRIATDGQGTWIAVWDSNDSLGGTVGTDPDIMVSRSTDAGATWTAPAALNTNAGADTGSDSFAYVSTDEQGSWVVVWRSDDSLNGTVGNDYDIFVARSTDNGATWTAPAALNGNAATDTTSDTEPQVVADHLGAWIAVWSADDAVGGDLDLRVATSSNAGVQWTAPQPLNTNAATDVGNDFFPQLAGDRLGNWVVVWNSNDPLLPANGLGVDLDIFAATSTNDGTTWSSPVAVNSNATIDSGGDTRAQLATDGLGNWLAAWHSDDSLADTIGNDFDIMVSHSTDAGATWSPLIPLNPNAATDSGNDGAVQLATAGRGYWTAVWDSNDSLGGTTGNDFDILTAYSVDMGATWNNLKPLNTDAATDTGIDVAPRLAVDVQENHVVLWSSASNLGAGVDQDIAVAIPEPETPLMLMTGAMALIALSRKRLQLPA